MERQGEKTALRGRNGMEIWRGGGGGGDACGGGVEERGHKP